MIPRYRKDENATLSFLGTCGFQGQKNNVEFEMVCFFIKQIYKNDVQLRFYLINIIMNVPNWVLNYYFINLFKFHDDYFTKYVCSWKRESKSFTDKELPHALKPIALWQITMSLFFFIKFHKVQITRKENWEVKVNTPFISFCRRCCRILFFHRFPWISRKNPKCIFRLISPEFRNLTQNSDSYN